MVTTWVWAGLPEPSSALLQKLRAGMAVLAVAVLVFALWKAAEWQNSIRRVWDLPELDTIAPVTVAAMALAVFAVIVLSGRLFAFATGSAYRRIRLYVPPRIAGLSAVLLAGLAFYAVASGVIFDGALQLADGAARQADAFIAPDQPRPVEADRTGSAVSLVG